VDRVALTRGVRKVLPDALVAAGEESSSLLLVALLEQRLVEATDSVGRILRF
jgi:hypothetical protein